MGFNCIIKPSSQALLNLNIAIGFSFIPDSIGLLKSSKSEVEKVVKFDHETAPSDSTSLSGSQIVKLYTKKI